MATEAVLTPDSPHSNGMWVLKGSLVPSQLTQIHAQMPRNMETSQAPVSPQESVSVNRIDMLRSMETRYEKMLLEEVPWYLNLLAEFTHWMLLAGYLVIPGMFTLLQKSESLEKNLGKTEAGKAIVNTIKNPPLVAIAVFLFVLGAVLTVWLFWKQKHNYIWLVNRLFM